MKGKKKGKTDEKTHRPLNAGHKKASQPGASGVPGTGGSRQGNIGHQTGDQNDNAHR